MQYENHLWIGHQRPFGAPLPRSVQTMSCLFFITFFTNLSPEPSERILYLPRNFCNSLSHIKCENHLRVGRRRPFGAPLPARRSFQTLACIHPNTFFRNVTLLKTQRPFPPPSSASIGSTTSDISVLEKYWRFLFVNGTFYHTISLFAWDISGNPSKTLSKMSPLLI